MNPLEERLNRLETRVTRYRNFNVLLCLLLVTVVTVAARDGASTFQAKSIPDSFPMAEARAGVPDTPDRGADVATYSGVLPAGKLSTETQGVIRATGLQIVNSAGQAVIELWPGIAGSGYIAVNSDGKRLVYVGYGVESGDGLITINSTEEKRLIGIGSGSETRHGGIWVRNSNEEVLISMYADETPAIHINKAHKNLAYLGASTPGNGLLSLKNKSGKRLAYMFADEMSGHVNLSNKYDNTIAYLGAYSDYLGANSDGAGVLEIFSKNGTNLITAGSTAADNGLIRLSGSQGALRVELVAENDHGIIRTKDAKVRTLAELKATPTGDGLVRTLSRQGITTWSSDSFSDNAGSTSLKGDMDNDGDIDGDDFLIFSENFGKRK